MSNPPKPGTQNSRNIQTKSCFWAVPTLLATVLALLFWRSFLPNFVHFSNDGPLGQNMPDWIQPLPGLTGMWDDMNSVGIGVGSWTTNLTFFLRSALGVIGFSKFYPPLAIFILGTCAWTFFRALKFSTLAAALGAIAAMLNSAYFSAACWGVGSQEIGVGMDFLALALVVANTAETPWHVRLTRLALAGLCVGMNVMEAADIGALFSILVAAFVFYKSLIELNGSVTKKAASGVFQVAIISAFAGFIALQTVLALVGSQIQGVAGAAQDSTSKAQNWDWATQWSLPKTETLGLVVPGLFGYKMDTPKDMAPSLRSPYEGGIYWGGVGRSPEIDRWLEAGATGQIPPGFMRFTGGGNYCGILVCLMAAWTIAQSFRKKDSPFSLSQRKLIWFWAVVLLASLLLAWGRFAPLFYGTLYQLPYFSTIRNPTKFLFIFAWAVVILFAYGIHALSQKHLNASATQSADASSQLKNWWGRAGGFDRRWTQISWGLLGASVLGWLIFSSDKIAFVSYLQKMGFPDETFAKEIATFCLSQVGWFVILLGVALTLITLVLAGYFSGSRARLGAVLLGTFLLFDLVRADLPYVTHWDYKQKYEVGTLNPVIEQLAQKPYEQRVAGLPFRAPEGMEMLDQLYRIEWMQHHFPFYNIQCLDIIQMPRMPEDLKMYLEAFSPNGTAESAPLMARRWELANTRYLLGAAGYLDVMNQQLDPVQKRFRIAQRFEIVPKSGTAIPYGIAREEYSRYLPLEKDTVEINQNGRYALFEFTGALPRAKLYANWQVNTNDQANLKTLADLAFNPAQTVLISTPSKNLPAVSTNDNVGTVAFQSYAPKHIVFSTTAPAASVLLLNDKYDPNWTVTVDGQPAELLRCNFLMRGVAVPAGNHTVKFNFMLPNKPFYVTVTALVIGLLLCGVLAITGRRSTIPPEQV